MSTLFPVFGSRAWVFGVLNVTPDSFSDGGRWDHTDTAIEHGRETGRRMVPTWSTWAASRPVLVLTGSTPKPRPPGSFR